MSEKVVALIPAHNEEKFISATIESLKSTNSFSEICVVNDGSDDETGLRAQKSGATVIELARMGKGQALNGALEKKSDFDILLIVDGDLGESAKYLTNLIEPIEARKADMTIASFPRATRKGGLGLVKGLARILIAKRAGRSFKSPLSGQRAIRRELLEKILPFQKGYAVEVAATIKALNLGAEVMEIPLPLKHRETGRDLGSFAHRGRQFIDLLLYSVRR